MIEGADSLCRVVVRPSRLQGQVGWEFCRRDACTTIGQSLDWRVRRQAAHE